MAKNYVYEWAVGNLEDRAKLEYAAADQNAAGVSGVLSSGFVIPEGRVPYKMEDTGNGVYYLTYGSGKAQILRIKEM